MLTKRRYQSLLFTAMVLSFCAAGTQAADILFISSMDATHKPGDDALKAFMEKMGHTVTYFDDNETEAATEAAAKAADLVFISESVGSSNIRNEITEIAKPMVITESWAWDEMGLTSGGGAGQNVVTTNIEIVEPAHPLAAGFTGSVSVLTDVTGARGAARLGNGIAGNDATVVARATLADGQTYDVLFVYDKGAALAVAPADGSPQIAADIRVCLGLDEQSYLLWNDNAYALLKAAINYGLGTLSDPGLATRPDPANGALAVATPLFKWKGSRLAALHNIYLGKTPELGPADLVAPNQPLAMYWHVPGLEPGVTYYWRVDEVEADGKTVHAGTVWSFTTQALTAYHPDPADGAMDASPAPTLTWLPGVSAVQHHVYLSDTLDAVKQRAAGADKGARTETTFVAGTLEAVTAYYWCVDEIAPGGEVRAGPVWTFTTFLPVDDFESYTDDDGSRIYQTWIDGYSNGLSGSTVGYATAPFAEQKIVHGGKQSMPLDYNNVKTPFYSEAEREFAPTQDWMVNGVKTLVLYVRGVPTNGAAALYLVLEDASKRSGVAICPDATAVTTAKWTEWRIPLSDFAGVNAAKIKKISLGLGDRQNPKAGGAGIVYIDDIRVVK